MALVREVYWGHGAPCIHSTANAWLLNNTHKLRQHCWKQTICFYLNTLCRLVPGQHRRVTSSWRTPILTVTKETTWLPAAACTTKTRTSSSPSAPNSPAGPAQSRGTESRTTVCCPTRSSASSTGPHQEVGLASASPAWTRCAFSSSEACTPGPVSSWRCLQSEKCSASSRVETLCVRSQHHSRLTNGQYALQGKRLATGKTHVQRLSVSFLTYKVE